MHFELVQPKVTCALVKAAVGRHRNIRAKAFICKRKNYYLRVLVIVGKYVAYMTNKGRRMFRTQILAAARPSSLRNAPLEHFCRQVFGHRRKIDKG